MKTRTLVLIPIFIFAACTNNEDVTQPGGSFFTYDGTIYSLTSAFIEEYGVNTEPGESGYDLDFIAFSYGMSEFVYLDLTSPNSTLASGTYTWSNTRTDFTLAWIPTVTS